MHKLILSIFIAALASVSTFAEVRGDINNVTIRHEVSIGEPGVRISADVTVKSSIGKEIALVAYFYDSKGHPLEDKNNEYRSADGKVAVQKVRTTRKDYYSENLNVFMPYRELHVNADGYYYVNLALFVDGKRIAYETTKSFYYKADDYSPSQYHLTCAIPGTDKQFHAIGGDITEFDAFLKQYGFKTLDSDNEFEKIYIKDSWIVYAYHSMFSRAVFKIGYFCFTNDGVNLFNSEVSSLTAFYGNPKEIERIGGDPSKSLSYNLSTEAAKYSASWETEKGEIYLYLDDVDNDRHVCIGYEYVDKSANLLAIAEIAKNTYGESNDIVAEPHVFPSTGTAPYVDGLIFWHAVNYNYYDPWSESRVDATFQNGIINSLGSSLYKASEVEMLLTYFEYTGDCVRNVFGNDQTVFLKVRLVRPTGRIVGFEQSWERTEGDWEYGGKIWLDAIGNETPGYFIQGKYLLEVFCNGTLLFSVPFVLS